MLNDQENVRLAEMEQYLLITDPRFVRRMMREKRVRRVRFFGWFRRRTA